MNVITATLVMLSKGLGQLAVLLRMNP